MLGSWHTAWNLQLCSLNIMRRSLNDRTVRWGKLGDDLKYNLALKKATWRTHTRQMIILLRYTALSSRRRGSQIKYSNLKCRLWIRQRQSHHSYTKAQHSNATSSKLLRGTVGRLHALGPCWVAIRWHAKISSYPPRVPPHYANNMAKFGLISTTTEDGFVPSNTFLLLKYNFSRSKNYLSSSLSRENYVP